MSDTIGNEKKNTTEHRVAGSDNHRNSGNNGNRKYHHRRPYPKNNDKGNSISGNDKNASLKNNSQNGDAQNNVKKTSQPNFRNNQKKSADTVIDGNRDNRKNQRSGNFERRKNSHSNVRVEETIQDIDIDIGRIEKEIELEIKEISAFKFGL